MPADKQTALMLKMRSDGKTYRQIGATLGLSPTTVRRRLNPGAAERERKQERGRERKKYASDQKYREQRCKRKREKYDNNLGHRCQTALRGSRRHAKKYGYTPCNADIDKLVKAFTGYCVICGAAESDCNRRLVMDHCHITGNFRGWLCEKHNKMLGLAGDNAAVLYRAANYVG